MKIPTFDKCFVDSWPMWIGAAIALSLAAQTPKQSLDPKLYKDIKEKQENASPPTVGTNKANTNAIRRDARAAADASAKEQAKATQAAIDAAVAAEEAARIIGDTQAGVISAANQAKTAADSAHQQTASLLIVQTFALVTFILLLCERLWYRLQDWREEKRDHDWKVESTRMQLEAAEREKALTATVKQVHALVNSEYTAALEKEMSALEANFVLLQSNIRLLEQANLPTDDVIAAVVTVRSRISELTKQLVERAAETKRAADQLAVDLSNIHPAPEAAI